MLRVEAQQVAFFETPIAYCRLKNGEEVIAALEKSIRARHAESEGVNRSNFGGWHSDTEMLKWGGEAATELADTTVKICKRLTHFQDANADSHDWIVRMWANVSPKGGMNHLHSHPGNLWAAVLYIDMGAETEGEESSQEVGGEFYVEDPRFPLAAMRNPGIRMTGSNGEPQQYEVQLKLERGNLVVFPAWLRHGVKPYFGNRERISIAMNVDARPKT